jgi:hypothetical protein
MSYFHLPLCKANEYKPLSAIREETRPLFYMELLPLRPVIFPNQKNYKTKIFQPKTNLSTNPGKCILWGVVATSGEKWEIQFLYRN